MTSANLSNVNDPQLADIIWEITSGTEMYAVTNKVITSSNNFEDLGKFLENLANVTTKVFESCNRLQLDINEIKTEINDRQLRPKMQ